MISHMHVGSALGVGIGLGTAGLVVSAILLFLRGLPSESLGSVSEQWVAQHRAEPLDDRQ